VAFLGIHIVSTGRRFVVHIRRGRILNPVISKTSEAGDSCALGTIVATPETTAHLCGSSEIEQKAARSRKEAAVEKEVV
jgi:hypothetical protein